jgi:spermidine dehydrogenase
MAAAFPSITRRDFLNGAAFALGTPALARAAMEGQTDALLAPAHANRDDPARWRGGTVERDDGVEDLVVVGAGISGLAGAWLFRRHAGRPVRVLVLDALDEVGGHARRNEFVSRSGRRLVGYGGSQSLDTPGLFSPAVHGLLQGVGIELQRFKDEFYDAGWAQRHGLVNKAEFFDHDAWGEARLVVRRAGEPAAEWLARTPLPPAAQADLARLLATPAANPLPGLSRAERRSRLAAMTYREFLLRSWRLHPAVAAYYQHTTMGYFGVGIDATSALDAWAAGLPGFDGLDLGDRVDGRCSPSGRQSMAGQDEYIYHFPDGNAGVARALLRSMRPELLPGRGMDTLSSARLDTAALDDPAAELRLRLRCTVVGLRHLGPAASAERVEVRYVDGAGRLRAVQARQVLLACWHRVIARLTDELPPAQVKALDDQVKVPLLYTTVLLSNWRAWQRAGVRAIGTPGGFWQEVALDFPVSIGELRFAASPDEPILLHLGKVVVPGDGRDARTQAAAGRAQLLGWRFEDLEARVRALLQGALGGHGFDGAREIEAITVNRWAHGYSYEYMRPWDRYWPGGPLPCETARRGWGRVAIAGSDSGAFAYAHSAIDQATRAVQELLPRAKLPAWARWPGPDPKAIGL